MPLFELNIDAQHDFAFVLPVDKSELALVQGKLLPSQNSTLRLIYFQG